jgi:hypothetical protein
MMRGIVGASMLACQRMVAIVREEEPSDDTP